jgi:alkylated DNA repair protein alkB family protein 6
MQLSGRRLQNYGGIVHPKGLLQAPIPRWLHPLMERMHQDTRTYGPHPPNHVLVNAYSPGQGILPHQDGPAYWPGVCILSLAAPAVIRFRRKLADGGSG